MKLHPPWSCYPEGLEPSRRGFLRALAAAAAASTLPAASALYGQEEPASPAQASDVPGDFPPGAVRLNFNENPLGPSPRAIEAILASRLADANRYNNIVPAGEAIARHHGVSEKEILLGCGSTEFLHISPWSFLRSGGSLLLPTPTYGWSAQVAEAMGVKVATVPLGPEGSIPLASLKKAVDRTTRLVYLANPNNPTGASVGYDELKALAEALPKEAALLIDEAYSDFLPAGKNAIDLARQGAPVISARTFSKAFGLAGLRLGYAIAPERLIEKLKTFWLGDLGINAAANVAAAAALADQDHVSRYVRTVDHGLAALREGFSALKLRSLPHRAPFVMVDLGQEAKPVVESLAAKNVYVRDGRSWEMPTYLRVSVGRPSENEAFLVALRQALGRTS